MRNAVLVSMIVFASNLASASAPCKSAMELAVKHHSPAVEFQTVNIMPVGSEPFVEVVALVYGWRPNADALSSFYYLVTATCRLRDSTGLPTRLSDLVVAETMPEEGGVIVKRIVKQRY